MSAALGRIAIVGAGQVGTMIGLALREAGTAREVALADRDPAVLARSLARGAGDRGLARADDALDADTIVVALPVPGIVEFVEGHGARVRDGTLVVDTGSVKAPVVAAMRRWLGPGVHAIGGHPLAGTERPGPDGADPVLLRDAPFALCPVRDDPEAIARASALVRAVGARPLTVDADAHDRAVARTSGLPHLVAFALARVVGRLDAALAALAASGYRGATRLAASDPAMVAGLLAPNAREVRAALDELRRSLDDLATRLDDPAELERALTEAVRS